MKYKVKYWINVDFIAEEIIDEKHIDFNKNDLGEYNNPTKNAKYVVLDTIKLIRRTYEEHGENTNDSIKESTSHK
jgi:hypothetical protein|tara:strand:+ start:778 stop:1002 length:225 start_codon:yes stop_codon:yes gene_type:complete